jgi:hypothetical protein
MSRPDTPEPRLAIRSRCDPFERLSPGFGETRGTARNTSFTEKVGSSGGQLRFPPSSGTDRLTPLGVRPVLEQRLLGVAMCPAKSPVRCLVDGRVLLDSDKHEELQARHRCVRVPTRRGHVVNRSAWSSSGAATYRRPGTRYPTWSQTCTPRGCCGVTCRAGRAAHSHLTPTDSTPLRRLAAKDPGGAFRAFREVEGTSRRLPASEPPRWGRPRVQVATERRESA